MKPRRTLSILLAVTLAVVLLPAAQRDLPVAEVTPGMVGEGRTVFEGTRVDTFTARILGVMRNGAGPQRHIILARLEGGPLAATGVIAGMSGSPVSVGGRLIGAVAYALGTFPKEPIAGITPIGEMRDATVGRRPARVSGPGAVDSYPISQTALLESIRRLLGRARPFATRPDDVEVLSGGGYLSALDRNAGVDLRPIATPLVLGGFTPEVRAVTEQLLTETGFTPVAWQGTPTAAARPGGRTAPTLAPGDAVGVELLSGDLLVGATGTVTDVEGDRVYAFGHPFFSLGPVQIPMTRAYVHALLPSLYSSTKLATTGEVIGTMTEDRATAVAGRLGAGPTTIPIRVTLLQGLAPAREFNFRVVDDQAFTPLLVYVAVLNVLSSYERQTGALTFQVEGALTLRGGRTVPFDVVASGDLAAVPAATAVAGPVMLLYGNAVEPVGLERIDVRVSTSEQVRSWTLERAWVDSHRVRPGDTVPLRVALRPYRGDAVVRTIPVEIPRHASGRLTLSITDGTQVAVSDQREAQWPQQVRTLDGLLSGLKDAPRPQCFYVRLLSSDPGVVVDGRRLPSLPASAFTVYDSFRDESGGARLRQAVLVETTIATDGVASGTRTLTIELATTR